MRSELSFYEDPNLKNLTIGSRISLSIDNDTFVGKIHSIQYLNEDHKLSISLDLLKIENKFWSAVKELHDRASKMEEEALVAFLKNQTHAGHSKMDQAKSLRVAANNLDNISAV